MAVADSNAQSLFPAIRAREDVATLLDVTWDALRYRLYRMPKDQLYRTFEIRKRGGGTRRIEAPSPELKQIQERLLIRLSEVYRPAACVHGFVYGRSIVSNAKKHVGSRILLNIDLKDFFPSIHIGRIIGLLKARPFGFGKAAAVVLAQICTYEGRLLRAHLHHRYFPT